LRLDTAGFFMDDRKLGLGSSAALTVALVAALMNQLGQWGKMTPSEALALCLRVHERFQGGIGSGADVATAYSGGTIRFQSGSMPVKTLLPQGLVCQFVWTGVPAGTTDYVKRLYAWRETHKTAYNRHFRHLGELSESAVSACGSNDLAQFLHLVAAYNKALSDLSDEAGLNFYTPVHRGLEKSAVAGGCVYKPSGAGGGDFGLLLSDNPARLAPVLADMQGAGYETGLAVASEEGVKAE